MLKINRTTDKDLIDELRAILSRSTYDYNWLANKCEWSYDKVRNLFNNSKNLNVTDYRAIIQAYKEGGLLKDNFEVITEIRESIIGFSADANQMLSEINKTYLDYTKDGYASLGERESLVAILNEKIRAIVESGQKLADVIMKGSK